jgi:hypothetical protein
MSRSRGIWPCDWRRIMQLRDQNHAISQPCHLPSLRSFSRRSCPPRIPSLASRRPLYLHRRTELERCCLVDMAIKVHPTGLVCATRVAVLLFIVVDRVRCAEMAASRQRVLMETSRHHGYGGGGIVRPAIVSTTTIPRAQNWQGQWRRRRREYGEDTWQALSRQLSAHARLATWV